MDLNEIVFSDEDIDVVHFGDELRLNDLLLSIDTGYGNKLSNSPTYSVDSGLDLQYFPSDDFLLSELSPVMNDVPLSFDRSLSTSTTESLTDLVHSSVSSSLHDHPYVIESVEKRSDNEIHFPEASSKSEFKRKINHTESSVDSLPLKKKASSDFDSIKENTVKTEKEDNTLCDIDIIECNDPDKFAYRDENGKTVVVDRSKKNAEMARLNRRRKKRYILNLENEMKSLQTRNDKLVVNKNENEERISTLENEVSYLLSVIKNQTMLSSVLKAISTSTDINVNSGSCITGGNGYEKRIKLTERLPGKRGPIDISENEYHTGGVCLHVSNQKVSLEFCSLCNQKQT